MARREAHLCGHVRGLSLWPGTGPSVWSGAGSFSVVRRWVLFCGQAWDPSVWSGARSFSVIRREAHLCSQARGSSLWPQAWGTYVWSGAGPFSVARRGVLLCGLAQGPSVWSVDFQHWTIWGALLKIRILKNGFLYASWEPKNRSRAKFS